MLSWIEFNGGFLPGELDVIIEDAKAIGYTMKLESGEKSGLSFKRPPVVNRSLFVGAAAKGGSSEKTPYTTSAWAALWKAANLARSLALASEYNERPKNGLFDTEPYERYLGFPAVFLGKAAQLNDAEALLVVSTLAPSVNWAREQRPFDRLTKRVVDVWEAAAEGISDDQLNSIQ